MEAKVIYNKITGRIKKMFCPFCSEEMSSHPLGFWCQNCKKGNKTKFKNLSEEN